MRQLFRAAVAAAAFAGTATSALAEPVSVPERLMGDLQADLELTDYQAAGIVGNLARETGNFRYLRELNPLIRGSRGGIGYGQWTGGRHDAFLSYADGRDPMSYEVNYGFLLQELEGPYAEVLAELYETGDAAEATALVMRGYLAPHPKHRHLEERVAFAKGYLAGDFTGAGCESVHRVYPWGDMEVVQECPADLADLRPRARPDWIGDGAPRVEDPFRFSSDRPKPRPERLTGSEATPFERVPLTVLLRADEPVEDPFRTAPAESPAPS
jgi:hypothetical protein